MNIFHESKRKFCVSDVVSCVNRDGAQKTLLLLSVAKITLTNKFS